MVHEQKCAFFKVITFIDLAKIKTRWANCKKLFAITKSAILLCTREIQNSPHVLQQFANYRIKIFFQFLTVLQMEVQHNKNQSAGLWKKLSFFKIVPAWTPQVGDWFYYFCNYIFKRLYLWLDMKYVRFHGLRSWNQWWIYRRFLSKVSRAIEQWHKTSISKIT